MRYLTRELYDSFQSDDPSASDKLKKAQLELAGATRLLADYCAGVAEFAAWANIHDARITDIREDGRLGLDVFLDMSNCVWPEGRTVVHFSDVEQHFGLDAAIGRCVVWIEVLPRTAQTFECSILMDAGELSIYAASVSRMTFEYPPRVLCEHYCGLGDARVVLLGSTDTSASRSWILYTPDVDEDPGALLRNEPFWARISSCPNCGQSLSNDLDFP